MNSDVHLVFYFDFIFNNITEKHKMYCTHTEKVGFEPKKIIYCPGGKFSWNLFCSKGKSDLLQKSNNIKHVKKVGEYVARKARKILRSCIRD